MKCWVAPKILKTVQIPHSLFGLETLRFEAWTLDRDLASGLSTMIDNGWPGLDQGDRQALEQRYTGCDPPCLLDSSDGRSGYIESIMIVMKFECRFVLKGVNYNPLDVMNVLMLKRGYKVEGDPQQRTLPSIHHKDDKWEDYF